MVLVVKRGSAFFIALVFLFVSLVGISKAQVTTGSGNGFRISPVRSEFTIEKGTSQQLDITIENPTDAAVTATPVVNDFISNDTENGEPRLILDDSVPAPKNSFKNLVDELLPFQLAPREKKDVSVQIKVPENANSGGYYGAIRFVPSESTVGQGNVGLTASVGTIILIRVPGNLTERLDLLEVTAAQKGRAKSFFTGGDVGVLTRLKNEGDIHLQPFGKVQVRNIFGKVVHEYEFNNIEPRSNVLPGSIRRFEDNLAKPSGGWLGRYTITANIGFSQGSGDIISTSASFWYLPPWALIGLLIIMLGLVGGGYILYRKFSLGKPRHGVKR